MRLPLLALLLAAPLAAQGTVKASHPDLTGVWVLDPAKNVVDGPLQGPSAATYTVGMHGDSITVDMKYTAPDGEMQMKKLWATDGYTWINYMKYQGTDLTLNSVIKWNGPVLAIQTTTDFGGTPVTQAETWTLGAEGKTLTIVTVTSVNGAAYASVTTVFNKK